LPSSMRLVSGGPSSKTIVLYGHAPLHTPSVWFEVIVEEQRAEMSIEREGTHLAS
jgi:hypothetical protein